MIYDTLDHISCYRGLGTNMDCALDYLAATDFDSLTPGRYEIDGVNVYLMIQETELRNADDGQFEVHRRYADIQLALTDGEAISVLPVEKIAKWRPFDTEKDIGFSDVDDKGILLPLPTGSFMILFPQDAHLPCIKLGSARSIRKAVVKVLLDT